MPPCRGRGAPRQGEKAAIAAAVRADVDEGLGHDTREDLGRRDDPDDRDEGDAQQRLAGLAGETVIVPGVARFQRVRSRPMRPHMDVRLGVAERREIDGIRGGHPRKQDRSKPDRTGRPPPSTRAVPKNPHKLPPHCERNARGLHRQRRSCSGRQIQKPETIGFYQSLKAPGLFGAEEGRTGFRQRPMGPQSQMT